MEESTMDDFIRQPLHPYAKGLLSSTPVLGDSRERLTAIGGQPPNLRSLPQGCPFALRCEQCMDICREKMPPSLRVAPEHRVRCWQYANEPIVLSEKGAM